MKRIFALIIMLVLSLSVSSHAEDKQADPSQSFYTGNALYEKRDYEKAVNEYSKALNAGVANSNLYYNIGNAYFKMGKLGYAILFYERAKRLSPQDPDLESNLTYAKSLVGNPAFQLPSANPAVSFVKRSTEDFSIKALGLSMLLLYFIIVILLAIFLTYPVAAKKNRLLFAAVLLVFIIDATGFAIRYYDELIIKTGIVVQKSAECKYEPIDKSTLFYRLQEGDEVRVIKTRNSWRQIKRADGKIGWVDSAAIEIV